MKTKWVGLGLFAILLSMTSAVGCGKSDEELYIECEYEGNLDACDELYGDYYYY